MRNENSTKFITCVKVYSDGASRRNPGPSAIGVVLLDQDNEELERLGQVVGTATATVAEYLAVQEGLDRAAGFTRFRVECFVDSDVVEGHLTGRYRLGNRKIRELFHVVKDYERAFDEVVYSRVDREDQLLRKAHKLAHDALNGRAKGATA